MTLRSAGFVTEPMTGPRSAGSAAPQRIGWPGDRARLGMGRQPDVAACGSVSFIACDHRRDGRASRKRASIAFRCPGHRRSTTARDGMIASTRQERIAKLGLYGRAGLGLRLRPREAASRRSHVLKTTDVLTSRASDRRVRRCSPERRADGRGAARRGLGPARRRTAPANVEKAQCYFERRRVSAAVRRQYRALLPGRAVCR